MKNHFSFLLATCTVGMAFTIMCTGPLWAESAPVFDVDNNAIQQAENNDASPQEEYPMPPPPQGQGQEGTFVPMQPEVMNEPPPRERRETYRESGGAGSSARIDVLQNQVQTLRGQVEHLQRLLEDVQNQQAAIMVELEKRNAQPVIATTSTTIAPNGVASKNVVVKPTETAVVAKTTDLSHQPDVAEEQQIYQTAYNLIKAKKYNDAVNVLQNMLKKYPSGQFASNAHYWLGELYGLLGKNDQALSEFSTVVKSYPDSPRLSDAQLKIGLIYAADLKWADAKAAFKKVINRYPGTTSSRLASEQLKQIKQAGH
ncbi:MAG: tol-pal system protein YbgF [Gammaproteobacteria bacterium]|nr:tol-pal system protein YbgF [Gammaproteobacteria bacterium]